MAKSLAASKKVMKNYLSELLTDEPLMQKNVKHELTDRSNEKVIEDKRLETLLKNVNAELEVKEVGVTTRKNINENIERKEVIVNEIVEEKQVEPFVTHKSTGTIIPKQSKAYRQGDFQALFFNVGGLTVAVPLIELGGIHPIEKTTSLMGKPDWFKGVMLYRDEKINVVDTALWVMPEKCDEKMKSSLNYQYVIMLSDSVWGLTAENLVDTVVLKQDEVKWLDTPSKRPWLAGLVKDKMCALLDVDSLIQLLNDGSGIHQDE
jgi:purine-binding chemotaxis protein CheW